MKQLNIDALYLFLFVLSVIIAAFILWMIQQNKQIIKENKEHGYSDVPGEGIDFQYSEWPYFEDK